MQEGPSALDSRNCQSAWAFAKQIPLALLALCFLALAGQTVRAQTEEAKLEVFFQHYLDDSFRMRPLDATRLGDHRFDDRLGDLSARARQGWVEQMRKTLETLPKAVDYVGLPRSGQIDYEILRHELVTSIWLAENTHPFEKDPRVYNDYINDSIYLLLTQSTLPKETNIANCIARMGQIPR